MSKDSPYYLAILTILIFCLILTCLDVRAEQKTNIAISKSIPSIGKPNSIQSSDVYSFKRKVIMPVIGLPTGSYTNEFTSSSRTQRKIELSSLLRRPFIGTETYWIPQGDDLDSNNERKWLRELELDFLRIENLAGELENGNDDSNPYTDFTGWEASDFEQNNGWNFNDPEMQSSNLINHYDEYVQFPLMMVMHYGGESYMNDPPNSEEYAEYFLATVYYNNVIKGRGIRYWEVLNEPDWGWKNSCSPKCYAEIFKKITTRIKNHPNPLINSIRLGGAVQGSGDPIDGRWPNGFPNKVDDGGRGVRDYVPSMLRNGSRPGKQDIGLVTWHDYGEEGWGSSNPFTLDNTYVWYNRAIWFYKQIGDYLTFKGPPPLMGVSELNFDAGSAHETVKYLYKSFYSNLWHASALNNYFATGKIDLISHFRWKGHNGSPKSFVYKDLDSNNKLIRNPIWWGYKNYIEHTAELILASCPGIKDRWTDAIVTVDRTGKLIYLIAVNKSHQERSIKFSFNIPSSMYGNVRVSKQTMRKSGRGPYGAPFAEPIIEYPYQFQRVHLDDGKKLQYKEKIPAQTIVYYTLVKE